MKLNFIDLTRHLNKQLPSFYLLSGDEIQLQAVASQLITAAAKKQAYLVKHVTLKDEKTWQDFYNQLITPSLFHEQQCCVIDTNQQSLKPAMLSFLGGLLNPIRPGITLVLQTKRLTKTKQDTALTQLAMTHGVHLALWPLQSGEFARFLKDYAQTKNIQLSNDAWAFFLDYQAGHVLSALQHLEQLALLNTNTAIDLATLQTRIEYAAHLDAFQWINYCLQGDIVKALSGLQTLQDNDSEVLMILGSFTRTLRILATLANASKAEFATTAKSFNIPFSQLPFYQTALQRHKDASFWEYLLTQALDVDVITKGGKIGDAWHSLCALGISMCQGKMNTFTFNNL